MPLLHMGVTILVPTYNMSAYLIPLAESILKVGLLPQIAEVIFVDDGSVDATPHILESLVKDPRFEDKIRVLRLEPNRGRFFARFEGAKMAGIEQSELRPLPEGHRRVHM